MSAGTVVRGVRSHKDRSIDFKTQGGVDHRCVLTHAGNIYFYVKNTDPFGTEYWYEIEGEILPTVYLPVIAKLLREREREPDGES